MRNVFANSTVIQNQSTYYKKNNNNDNNFVFPVVAEENRASKTLCFATSKISRLQINVSLAIEYLYLNQSNKIK